MHDDLMQREIAFQAFAKTIVDVLPEAKPLSAEPLASRLEDQIASIQLRDLEAPSAH